MTMMRRPVLSDQPAAIQAKHHRKMLQSTVVHDVVKSALQKCRIDAATGRIPRPPCRAT